MKIFTNLLLSCCFMLAANFALAQCGSIVNISVECLDPIPVENIDAPIFCNSADYDCATGVTEYFIVNPGNIVSSSGTVGAEIIGTSPTSTIIPADFGFPEGTCLEVVEVCFDLVAMQNIVTIFSENASCCTVVDFQFSGACSGILTLHDAANLPQDLADVVNVVNAFNLDDMGNPLPISIDFFASIADQIHEAAVLLDAVCPGAVPISYCTDTIPNSAPNVMVVDGPCIPLSIEMSSLEGANSRMGNQLKWTTSSETDNEYFMIERSFDGVTFEEVGIVEGAGNSSIASSYKFMDDKVSGHLNYYRVSAVSYSAHKDYSNTIAIETSNTSVLDAVDIVPNPVTSTMTLSFDSDVVGTAQIYVVDGTGKRVMDFTMDTVVGYNQLDQEMSELSNGIYMTIIQVGDQMASEKFLKL